MAHFSPSPFILPFPIIIGDIGGTNARFALVTDADGDVKHFQNVETIRYPDIQTAIQHTVLDQTAMRPRTAILAVAGPIHGDAIHLTNANWVIEPDKIAASLALSDIVLMNDFEAQALALPSLGSDDLSMIGDSPLDNEGSKVVLGPGTGLGAAGLVHAAHMWVPVPGEAGHVDFAPVTEEDYALWPHITSDDGRITAESLLSGPGLLRLYHAVASLRKKETAFTEPESISHAGLHKQDPIAIETLTHFNRLLGRYAGDLALIFMATGGVYIAGGIAPQIVQALGGEAFRAAFEDKAPHRELMHNIGSAIITTPKPPLLGLAAFAQMPFHFGIELKDKHWSF